MEDTNEVRETASEDIEVPSKREFEKENNGLLNNQPELKKNAEEI